MNWDGSGVRPDVTINVLGYQLFRMVDADDDGSEGPPFECELCDDRFETREELNDHVWEYHEMDGDVTT